MTELTKYIGPDLDVPSMGYGVGLPEVGEKFLAFHGDWRWCQLKLFRLDGNIAPCSSHLDMKLFSFRIYTVLFVK